MTSQILGYGEYKQNFMESSVFEAKTVSNHYTRISQPSFLLSPFNKWWLAAPLSSIGLSTTALHYGSLLHPSYLLVPTRLTFFRSVTFSSSSISDTHTHTHFFSLSACIYLLAHLGAKDDNKRGIHTVHCIQRYQVYSRVLLQGKKKS